MIGSPVCVLFVQGFNVWNVEFWGIQTKVQAFYGYWDQSLKRRVLAIGCILGTKNWPPLSSPFNLYCHIYITLLQRSAKLSIIQPKLLRWMIFFSLSLDPNLCWCLWCPHQVCHQCNDFQRDTKSACYDDWEIMFFSIMNMLNANYVCGHLCSIEHPQS